MLFKNVLDDKYRNMLPVFERMLNMAMQNQTHYADLLLVNENAGYYKDTEKTDNLPFIPSPYTTGPQMEGHSEDTHHKFIGQYIKGISSSDYEEYTKKIVYDPLRTNEIDTLIDEEAVSIQIEMIIYIKIWESDSFIKKFYQLARLINGEAYDWHFKIKGHDKNDKTGLPKSVLIRDHIIKKFKDLIPSMHTYLSNSYISQIRNAIAHSQYAILGRNIMLNNYLEGNTRTKSYITFDEWIQLFHETLVLFTLYNEFVITVNEIYYNQSQVDEGSIEIRINRLHSIEEIHYRILYTRPFFKDWSPYKSEDVTLS